MRDNPQPLMFAEASPQLDGVAGEFRTALLDEIEAARRASASSAVQLRDGRRISQVGASYQYQFGIESALQLPDDSPGDLFLEGRPPLEVTILSVEGLRIVLSVAENLGPFVPRGRLQSNLVHLLRRLVERIETIGANAAGDRLLRIAPSRTIPGRTVDASLHGQERAVAVALSFDTSFIWGPPGTGKTFTIGQIGARLAQSGDSLLLVSHTNTAVDQAILAIAEALGSELVDGTVIRVGEPRDRRLLDSPRLLASTHVEELSAVLVARRDELNAERLRLVDRLQVIQPLIELGEWALNAAEDIARLRDDVEECGARSREAEAATQQWRALLEQREEREQVLDNARNAESAVREIEGFSRQLSTERLALQRAETRVTQATDAHRAAEVLLTETSQTSGLLRRWRGLPKPEVQRAIVERHASDREAAQEALDGAARAVAEVERALSRSAAVVEAFRRSHHAEPSEVVQRTSEFLDGMNTAEATARALLRQADTERMRVARVLSDRLSAIREWGLVNEHVSSTEPAEMLAAIEAAHATASAQVPAEMFGRLRTEAESTNGRVASLDAELREIDEELSRVEEVVVGRATVVATTLTRAYLRLSILKRRFDWVVLDEASMAPIPALWAVAALSDRAVSAVGDFRQLPPIKHSTHPLAEKWLGRDVFTASGVQSFFEEGQGPPTTAILTDQRRMHPHISAIPNQLVYGGVLRDGDGVEDDSELTTWYDAGWGHDAPVLLVDTASTNAWVTSVKGANRSSRLNFLSATVCVDLAARILRDGRPNPADGTRPRVMIACPYRPHARLLNLLVREQGLERDVVAGTAHSFQGSEASVVIFDLVNDEPHWRVALFNPAFDDTSMRLLNVALTRARRRLIVVGDFDWVRKNGRRAFLGRLVEFLLDRYPVVDAIQVLPEGLAARAAEHHQALIGGDVRSETRQIYTQADFYPAFLADLSQVQQRAIIYSPFMTTDRLAAIGTHLQAAAERGAEVFIVTKTIGERPQRDQGGYRELEVALTKWGALVIHKKHMHEKLAFFDEKVLWSGSLNCLSFSNTQEVMERRESREVVQEYARTLRLEEMLAPYRQGETACPFCGGEVFPAEGTDEPFYWRCVTNGCHTRSIGQAPPRDGIMTCANCGGSVHLGEWGGKPAWRCDANPRHRRPLVRTHLRLPTVRGMIPRKELAKLDKQFGITETHTVGQQGGNGGRKRH